MKRFLFTLILLLVPGLASAQPNWGDFTDGVTFTRCVNTVGTDGVAETITAEDVLLVKDGATVITVGVTFDDDVSLDFGGGAAVKTGLHKVTIDTTQTGITAGEYDLVYKAGTVDSVSTANRILATFSVGRAVTANVTYVSGQATTAEAGTNFNRLFDNDSVLIGETEELGDLLDDAEAGRLAIQATQTSLMGPTGTVDTGASNTISSFVDDALASAVVDHWEGARVVFLNGEAAGEARLIIDSTTAGVLTFSPPLSSDAIVDSITTYRIVYQAGTDNIMYGGEIGAFSGGRPNVNASHVGGTSQTGHDVGAFALGMSTVTLIADSGNTTTLVDAALTQPQNFWIGSEITFGGDTTFGGTANVLTGMTVLITAFDDASNTLTFTPALTSDLISDGVTTYRINKHAPGSGGAVTLAAGAITASTFGAGAIDAAAIANAAIDLATFAGDVGIFDPATEGVNVDSIDANAITDTATDATFDALLTAAGGGATTGTTTAGAAVNTFADTSRTEAADFWKGAKVIFTSGTLAGQSKTITAYTTTGDVFTFTPALAANVPVGTTYRLVWSESDSIIDQLYTYNSAEAVGTNSFLYDTAQNVWLVDATAAQSIAGSFGKTLGDIDTGSDSIVQTLGVDGAGLTAIRGATGTTDAASASTVAFSDAERTEADSFWVGAKVIFTSGTLAGQVRTITAFANTGDLVTFAPAVAATVPTGTTYRLAWDEADVLVWNADATPAQSIVGSFGDAVGDPAATGLSILDRIGTPADFDAGGASLATLASNAEFIEDQTDAIGSPTDLGSGTLTLAANLADIDGSTDALRLGLTSASGTASATSTTTTVHDTGRTEANANHWAGSTIVFTSGALAGQSRLITGFNESTDTITFAPAVSGATEPDNLTYRIVNNSGVQVTAFAADSITAAATHSDFATETGASVWNIQAELYQFQGTFGQTLGDSVADTNSIYKAVVTDATGISVGTDSASILTAIGTPTSEGSGTTLFFNLSDIEDQTDDIGTAGAGLTAAGAASGTASGTSTITTVHDAGRTEATADYWKGAKIIFTSGALGGQSRTVTGFNEGTDTLTYAPATGEPDGLTYRLVWSEVDQSLVDIHLDHLLAVDYDPASKPGVATALLNELVGDDGGVSRFTANTLETAWEVDATAAQAVAGSFGDAIGDPVDTGLSILDRIGTPVDMDAGGASLATLASNAEFIEAQTDDIGSAGAGLTAAGTTSGTASSTSTNATVHDAGRTETTSWVGAKIIFTSGSLAGQVRNITGFDSGTDILTFSPITAAETDGMTYQIVWSEVGVVWDELKASHAVADSFGDYLDDEITSRSDGSAVALTQTSRQAIINEMYSYIAAPGTVVDGSIVARMQIEANDALVFNHLDKLLGSAYVDANGHASSFLKLMTNDLSGAPQFTTPALALAPTGGGGGDPTAIASAVWTYAVPEDFDDANSAGLWLKGLHDDWASPGGRLFTLIDQLEGYTDTIADDVWDEPVDEHNTATQYGAFLEARLPLTLDSAGIATAVWNAATITYGSSGSYGLLAETNLDAAVTSRMASYTQPSGFLAATFPTTVASTTNITGGTITTVTNLTNAPSAGDFTATMKASIPVAVWNALKSAHTTDDTFGDYLDAAVSGVSTGGLSLQDIVDAVWNEPRASHVGPTTFGGGISGAAAPANFAAMDINGTGGVGVDWANVQSPSSTVTLSGTSTLALEPTTAGRKLDVTSTGAAGIDWANVESPTTTLNLSGTTVGNAGLDAVGVRAAIGLASANLDTQLSAIESGITWNTAWDAEVQSEVTDAIVAAGLSTLDAAGVRTAIGLATANLDTQLSTIDGVADAILVIANKIDTALQLDGAVYRFTTNALEQAPVGEGGGSAIPTDVDQEPVPIGRTWKLKRTSAGLVGEAFQATISTAEPTYAVDFVNDAATNQRIFTVDSVDIVSGSASGLSIGTAGRDRTQAKFRIEAVTAGEYTIRVTVTYNDGGTSVGKVILKVVN